MSATNLADSAKTIEISSESPDSFEDAIREGIRKAHETVKNIKSAWVADQLAEVQDGTFPWRVEFEDVHFSYPTAAEVSLASLESVAVLDESAIARQLR